MTISWRSCRRLMQAESGGMAAGKRIVFCLRARSLRKKVGTPAYSGLANLFLTKDPAWQCEKEHASAFTYQENPGKCSQVFILFSVKQLGTSKTITTCYV